MKKRVYRAETIKQVKFEKLAALVAEQRIVFGVDVAKVDFFGVFMDEEREVLKTIKWKHPIEASDLLMLLKRLPASKLEVAMEPSGTYGDTLRHLLEESGFSVSLVSPKRSKDACEVYDGVPSSHDAKSAAIIAKLHWDKASKPWPKRTDEERCLAAKIDMMVVHDEQYGRNLNRLEAKLARYWPELPTIFKLDSATLLRTIQEYGGPHAVAKQADGALLKMKKIGGSSLSMEKCRQAVDSSKNTIGVPMLDAECVSLKELATEILRNREAAHKVKSETEHAVSNSPKMAPMSKLVGRVTAAVLFVELGDPSNYHCAAAYQKAAGLNLKERSSGKHQGRLKITKRGSGVVRRYLFLAALRLTQRCGICRAWYHKKIVRDGGKHKMIAATGLTRKLITALWHVGQGAEFDPTKLFDVSRLNLEQ